MFSYLLEKPTIATLMFVDAEGVQKPISRDLIFPLSRLHLMQYIYLNRKQKNPPELWLGWIRDRVKKRYPEAQKLELAKLTLDIDPHANPPYKIVTMELLTEIPIHEGTLNEDPHE